MIFPNLRPRLISAPAVFADLEYHLSLPLYIDYIFRLRLLPVRLRDIVRRGVPLIMRHGSGKQLHRDTNRRLETLPGEKVSEKAHFVCVGA